jgi:hypothetical protein
MVGGDGIEPPKGSASLVLPLTLSPTGKLVCFLAVIGAVSISPSAPAPGPGMRLIPPSQEPLLRDHRAGKSV